MNEQALKRYRVTLKTVDGDTYVSTHISERELDEATADVMDALDEGQGVIALPGEGPLTLVRAAAVVAMFVEEVGE